jgi:hypothetical protein
MSVCASIDSIGGRAASNFDASGAPRSGGVAMVRRLGVLELL